MVLETLSGLIVQLVIENGRVMLPQLGAFMRETVPASFSDRGFTLLPPYRRLVFRESQGDGTLLCEALSRREKMSLPRAQAELEACVAELKAELEEQDQAEIPGLGRLKRTASGGLLFVQDEDLDVSGEWMALEAVSLKSQNRLAFPSQTPSPTLSPAVGLSPVPSEAPVSSPSPVPAREIPSVPADALRSPVPPPVMRDIASDEEEEDAYRPLWPKILIGLLVLLALAVALFYVGVHFFPDTLDKLLYDEKELELLKYFGLDR